MKNTTILFITLAYNPDFTFCYTVFVNYEVINILSSIMDNTINSLIPSISHINIPSFKESFDVFKPTILDINNNNNDNVSFDIIIEQVKTPKIQSIVPLLYWYTTPFYILGLSIEPLGKFFKDFLYLGNNIYFLVPVIGTSFIVFSSVENNNSNEIEDEINSNNQENTDINTLNIGSSRQFIRPSPYENEEPNLVWESKVKPISGFFTWDCFFDFKKGFVPYSVLYSGINVIEDAPNWSAAQLVNLILEAIRHSQYRHLRSIRHAIHIFNGNTIDESEQDNIIIKESIEEYLQYYVNTKIHLDILEYKYPEVYNRLRNFHYPVLYISEKDWNILKKRTSNFNLLDVMKDLLFIIVPNYNNVQDYLISESDRINYYNKNITITSDTPYLIRDYEPHELLNTIRIYENQHIENIIGLSVEELNSLISSLKEDDKEESSNEPDNIVESTTTGKKSIFKKLKEKIKKLYKKLKK